MPPKRSSPSPAVTRLPNKTKIKKDKDAPPPTPIPMPMLTNTMLVPEQINLATQTFEILMKDKMVILVGKDDYAGCAKTMVSGEANLLYTQAIVHSSQIE